MGPENLRQLRRAALTGRHRLSRRGLPQGIERAPRLAQIVARHVVITLRRTQAAMTQQAWIVRKLTPDSRSCVAKLWRKE